MASSHFPRRALSSKEKSELEKQFVEEVPEFEHYGENLLKFKGRSGFYSTTFGIVIGIFIKARSGQYLSGFLGGILGAGACKYACDTFLPTLYGCAKQKLEFDRAFNLWVYYQDQKPPEYPGRKVEEENFKTFMAKYLKSNSTKATAH